MVVCVCKGLTEAQLRTLIEGGSDTLDQLVCASGAGSECGGCWEVLRWMLHGMKQEMGSRACSQRCSEAHEDPRPKAHSPIQGVDREVCPPRPDR